MPRFEAYNKMFPCSERLSNALIALYEAVAGFCIDSVLLFRRHTISRSPIVKIAVPRS
jgi:hypothetical protein